MADPESGRKMMFPQDKEEEVSECPPIIIVDKCLVSTQARRQNPPQGAPAPTIPMRAAGMPGTMVMMPPRPPVMRPSLPPNLWPHNFIIISVVLAVIYGITNPLLTLPLTVIAIVMSVMVSSR